MSHSLASLPPTILSLITRLLGYRSLVNLVFLTGYKELYRACSKYGGVTEIQVSTVQEGAGLAFAPRLLTLPRLTRFFVNLSAAEVLIAAVSPWLLTLPLTMLELRLTCRDDLGAFLRPIDDVLDDTYTKSLWSLDGHTPILLKQCFPNLRGLRIMGLRRPSLE